MILAQNLLQRLSGNKIWILIFAVGFFASCELFKPVNNGNNNNNNNPDEIGEVGSNGTNDRDGDGVTDDFDKCPDTPGLVRFEGCPDENNDNSGGNNGDTGNNNSGNAGNDSTITDPKGGDIDTTIIEEPTIDLGLKSSYKVGILMPFFADEVSNSMSIPKQAIPGMNFYEGSLLALQQLSLEGVNLDVEVFDTRRSEGVVQGLVDNYTLSSMDLIIGPAASSNIKIVAEQVAKKEQVPMVSLNLNSTLVSDNPYFIQSSPYFASHASATVEYVKEKYFGKKVIMIVPNGGREMKRMQYYRDANKLQSGGTVENPFEEFLAEKEGSSFTFEGLIDALSYADTTVIIAPVSNEYFTNALLRTLDVAKASKPVVIFGMPSWMNYQNIDISMLETCNVHVTNGSFINKKDEKIKNFKQSFFNEYGAAPTVEAYKGYDLTMYFGRMLHKYGTGFINKLDEADETLLQSSFDFERVFSTTTDGEMNEDYQINYFENKYVHILRFMNYQYVLMNNPNDVFNNLGDD